VTGNILCVEIKLLPSYDSTTLEIREYLLSNLQEFKIPRIIKFVNELELTKTGKLKRK
jgi:acyl-CoA synthetase (AMP-forming)/AMP-acid ligase II